MIKLIVFDWDGTIYDSTAHIVQHTQSTARDLNLPIPTVSQARRVIGLIFPEAVQRLYPDISEDKMQAFIKRYQEYSHKQSIAISGLYEGAIEVLNQLIKDGYQLAVATSSSRRRLNNDLEHFALQNHFILTRCAEESCPKPHPQMLQEIMEYINVKPAETVMIGDTTYDMEMAIAANVTPLAVSYGAHSPEQLALLNIAGCLSDIYELPEWLKSIK